MEASHIGPTSGREADVAPAPEPEPKVYVTAPVTANPAALGLAGFALSTFILSMFNAHFINNAGLPILFGVILFYGGVAQFLAGMWEFRTGNTFGATIFGSYGAFWLALWAFYTLYAKSVPPLVLGHAVGVFLWGWAGFTAMLFVASLRTTGAVATTVLLLVVTEVVLAIGNDGGSVSTIKIGGYLGLATAAAAWYTLWAIVLESTYKRSILPVYPLARE
jgi:succinate-acetate transporter protein